MKRRTLVLLKCATCASAIGLMASCCAGEDKGKRIADLLSRDFARQVPLGSSKSAVITFLEHNKISYSNSPRLRMIDGLIRNVDPKSYMKPSVELQFLFDHEGRLTRYHIRPVYTSL